MKFSRYKLITFLLLAGIIFASMLIYRMWIAGERGFSFSGVVLLLLLFIFGVNYNLYRIRRLYLKFTDSLRNRDVSTGFSKELGDPFLSKMASEFLGINRDFGLIRRDKELQYHLFTSVIDHISFGIVVYNNQGKILLSNSSFRNIFELTEVKNITDLDKNHSEISKLLHEISKGEEKVAMLFSGSLEKKFLVLCNEFILDEEKLKIVSLRDVTRQIDESELEAWQKLIRVLRHEIMNTLSPVRLITSSLTSSVKEDKITDEAKENLILGLDSINRRVGGLANFVESYKSLNELPRPILSYVNCRSFLDGIEIFFSKIFQENNIMLNIDCESSINFKADEKLLEQVFINILNNSVEAVKDISSPVINIQVEKNSTGIVFQIVDNGKGVEAEELKNIFIPFYTTRDEGSGIGLSISRQIIQLHGGSVTAENWEGGGMVFRILIPA